MATKYVDNGDGTFSFLRDDGQVSQPFIDPDGSMRAQLDAATDPATGYVDPGGQAAEYLAATAPPPAGAPATDPALGGALETLAASDAEQQQQAEARAAAMSGPPAAAPAPAAAGGAPESPGAGEPQFVVIPGSPGGVQSTTTTTRSTQGLAGRDELLASGKEANEAQGRADQSLLDAKAKNLVNRSARVAVEQAKVEDQIAASNEAKNAIDARVKKHADKLAEERKVPIDPGQAVAGERGYYAFLAGLGMALQNFGAGLMGQGRAGNPADVVNQFVDRSVRLQLEQKRQNVEGAEAELADSKEEQLKAERNVLRLTDQELRLAEMQAGNVEELNLIKPMRDQVEARLKANEAKLATDLALKETKQTVTQSTRTPGTPDRIVSIDTAREKAAVEAEGTTPEKVTEYTKERIKTGADSAIDSAARARSVIEKLAQGQDVPGLGPLDEVLTKWGNDREGAAVSQVLGMNMAEFVRAISGAQATDAEAKRLQAIIVGPGWRPTKDTVLRGLGLIDSSARSKLKTLNGGYGAESRAYERIRGMQRNHAQLTPEQQRNRAAQLGG